MFKFFGKDKTPYIYSDSNFNVLQLYSTDDLLASFTNWSKNRPPDESRIENIREYYMKHNVRLVPGMIHVWFNPDDNTYKVYDGIHRYLAAMRQDVQMTMFIRVFKTQDEQAVIDDFININKSISVPSIYLEEGNLYKRIVCTNVTRKFCEKHGAFVSPSRKPYVYNFNRDVFTEFLSELQIDFTKENVDNIILNSLAGLNHYAQSFVTDNKIECPKKCHFHKFYLFYLDKNFIKSKIEHDCNK